MAYAEHTEVSVDTSKRQIEAMLKGRGAGSYATGWNATHDRIEFVLHHQTIRFTLPRVNPTEYETSRHGRMRSRSAVDKAVAQADRQRWRALYLVIKAKLEAVDAGIAVYEQEFLAFIVDRNTDLTVGDILVPRLTGGQPLQIGDGR